MKIRFNFLLVFLLLSGVTAYAQTVKVPSSCKVYLENKMVADVSLEDALKWSEVSPPQVQCDDGKVYNLESFHISYLTLKPFMKKDFGIGEGGFPIMAREAIKKGQAGDTIVLENVTYTDAAGAKQNLPVISVKIK